MTTYVGFDPSTKGAAYAKLDVRDRATRVYIEHGVLANEEELRRFLAFLTPTEIVAIERPSSVFHIRGDALYEAKAKAVSLIETSRTAGVIFGIATARGLDVRELGPERWRAAVVGRSGPSDDEVEARLRVLVPSWPAPRKSNPDHRDAGGVALGASMLSPVMQRYVG
jgi:Holliday junction resolvasome RuvABC endonuclease subunit